MMSQTSKRELLAAIRPRYTLGNRTEKQLVLDELVATTGYHRKYAIQVLNRPPKRRPGQRHGGQAKYTGPVRAALEQVWRAANCICGKRLVPGLPTFVEALERHGELQLDPQTRALLLTLSPATADRLLKRTRAGTKPHGLTTTKPGTLLKQAIPVRTFAQWDDAKPGFMEIDLVAHCGDATRGEYLNSLDMIDVKTRWVELYGLLNRSQATVSAAIVICRGRLPYALLGLDSDNGSEFINDDLKRYCEQEHITFTRCRPYKKNDQAYVEQKNWTAVRQNVGYDRYEGPAASAASTRSTNPCGCISTFSSRSWCWSRRSEMAPRLRNAMTWPKPPTSGCWRPPTCLKRPRNDCASSTRRSTRPPCCGRSRPARRPSGNLPSAPPVLR